MKFKHLIVVAAIFVTSATLLILRDDNSEENHGNKTPHDASITNSISNDQPELASGLPKNGRQGTQSLSTRGLVDDSINRYKNISNNDEKLAIIASLASLASGLTNGADRDYVLERLHHLATGNEDGDIKAFATINYSRLGPPDTAYKLLKDSRTKNVIDADAYYSEVARLSLSSDATQALRTELLADITSSENKYASEVMFSIIPTAPLSLLERKNLDTLAAYIDKSQPFFPPDIASIGVSSAMEYTNWLYSTAVLSTGSHDADKIVDYLMRRFDAGFSDPREAVSIFINNPFDRLNSAQAQDFNRLVKSEVDRYARAYPNNPIIQEISALPQQRR